jgi:hypothetical protein
MKSKRGIEAAGFGVLAGVIILLFSGGLLLAAIKEQSSKIDESVQVSICRISNEINFGIKEKTSDFVSGQQICNTIDKTKKKTQVPTSKYPQTNQGAELEIREMIKNCWHMWLDGSEGNVFRKYPIFGQEGCHVCYTFKIKEKIDGVTFSSLSNSMAEPFFVEDKTDKCAPGGGGLWKDQCEEEEITANTRGKSPSKCCAKGVRNECENKGGKCSVNPIVEKSLYNGWKCPKRGENCYVEKNDLYSYTRYIREFGKKGGDILFAAEEGATDVKFNPGEVFAVSFVSPNKEICTELGCIAAMGTYGIVSAAGTVVLAKFATVAGVITFVGKSALSLIGIKGLSLLVGYETGLLDSLFRLSIDKITSPFTIEIPNFIMVSTQQQAQEFGCTIEYGER